MYSQTVKPVLRHPSREIKKQWSPKTGSINMKGTKEGSKIDSPLKQVFVKYMWYLTQV